MNINDTKKNIIVLKNLPSNIIDEAIIVVKNKKNIKKDLKEVNKELVLKTINTDDIAKLERVSSKNKDYIVKEAELVVNNYIDNLVYRSNDYKNIKMEKRYNVLKYTCSVLAIISLISTLICVIK